MYMHKISKSYSLNRSEKEKIIEVISSCLSNQYEKVITAYLFGSFLQSMSFKDIDIGIIVTKNLSHLLSFELETEGKLQSIIKYPVDVRVLNQAPISFSQNVIRTGRIIIDKDPNLRADFETRILKQYYDFSPFQRRYLREVMNAPV